MIESGPLILPSTLTIVILLLCVLIIIFGKVGLSLGLYLAIISFGKAVIIGPIALIWLLAMTTIVSGAKYYFTNYSKKMKISLNNKWIIPWMIFWWFYTLTIIIIVKSPYSISLIRNLIMYIIVPIPIVLLFSKDLNQIKLFAFSYVFTTILNGLLILKMGGFNISFNLLGELQTGGENINIAIFNYHRIGVAFGIALIILFTFYISSKGIIKHFIIMPSFIFMSIMLFLIASKQMIFAIILSLLIYLYISMKTPRLSQKMGFFFLGFLMLIFSNWLFINWENLLFRGQRYDYSLIDALVNRQYYWQKGLK